MHNNCKGCGMKINMSKGYTIMTIREEDDTGIAPWIGMSTIIAITAEPSDTQRTHVKFFRSIRVGAERVAA